MVPGYVHHALAFHRVDLAVWCCNENVDIPQWLQVPLYQSLPSVVFFFPHLEWFQVKKNQVTRLETLYVKRTTNITVGCCTHLYPFVCWSVVCLWNINFHMFFQWCCSTQHQSSRNCLYVKEEHECLIVNQTISDLYLSNTPRYYYTVLLIVFFLMIDCLIVFHFE